MADISRLICEATGKAEQTRKRIEAESEIKHFSPAEDAGKKQAKLNWLSSSITEEMFLNIGIQQKQLIDTALDKASIVESEEERIKIIHLLIKAKTLRDVINTYSK